MVDSPVSHQPFYGKLDQVGKPELTGFLEGKAMLYEFEKGQNGVGENMHVSGQQFHLTRGGLVAGFV